MIFQPGILTMAWGSVVRQIAAGLDITLDEPLTEEVDRRPAERDTESVSGEVKRGDDGRGQVRRWSARSTASPRVVLEHVTRTDPEQVPEWEQPPPGGDGCYRVRITGEPMMQRRLHPPRRARRPQRLRDDHDRAADRQRGARGGRRRARHRPGRRPAAGHRPWAGEQVSILDRFAVPGTAAIVHRRRPRPRRRHRRRPGRGGRRRADLGPDRPSSSTWSPSRSARPAAGAWWSPPTSATSTPSPASPRRRTTRSAGSTPSSTTWAAPSRGRSSTPATGFLDARVQLQRRHRARADQGRRAADAEERRRPAVGGHDQLDDGPHRRPRLRRLRHRQGGARALDQDGGPGPRAADPGQRHLRRLDPHQLAGVRRRRSPS